MIIFRQIFSLLFIFIHVKYVFTGAIQLTKSNIDSILYSNELVFVNFYVNWCRFSQQLSSIYDQLADKIQNEYSKKGLITIGKVDCDLDVSLSKKYNINKYPTLKLYRNGLVTKREYRGARDIHSLFSYLKSQIESPIIHLNQSEDLGKLNSKFDYFIGYFRNNQSQTYEIFSKIAKLLRDQCHFVALINKQNQSISYRSNQLLNEIEYYNQSLDNEQLLYIWTNRKCEKVLRELTYENAEEFTDEGLPFLILFHRNDDQQSIKIFEKQIQKQLIHHRSTINCLHADGLKFVHPLKHLGKTINDLPLLVIDTFQHMFVFHDFQQIQHNNNLLEFVKDLHSGKLHRDFHVKFTNENQQSQSSLLLPSVFIRLSPSRQRYSFRDEL